MRVRAGRLASTVAVGVMNAALLAWFHDWFWAPADEGHFAHMAERFLDGQVLNADVESHHAGYVNVINAAALVLFGRRLASMRYPLMAAAFAQSVLVQHVLAPRGPWVAGLGALAATALGVLQFLNPSSYWYCLLLATAAIAWLAPPRPARGRIEGAGFLVGGALLFQQLPGAALGLGVLVHLLGESTNGPTRRPWLAWLVLAAAAAVVGAYLWSLADATAVLLCGVWPLLLIAWTAARVRASNATVLELLARLAGGALVAASPLVAYHLWHGSFGAWYQDAVVRPRGFPGLTFIGVVSHRMWMAIGLDLLRAPAGVGDVLNGAYWVLLPLCATAAGVATLSQVLRMRATPHVLAVVAAFYALIGLRYQIPVYLYYTVPLSVAAWLWLAPRTAAAAVVPLIATALVYHAGEPIRPEGMFRGERKPLARAESVERLGLWIDADDARVYAALVERILRETSPGEPIFAFPYAPELYFLSDRPNPFRFSLLPLHVRGPADVAAIVAGLDRVAPRLVVHKFEDKYNQPVVGEVLAAVEARYQAAGTIGPFRIYRRR